MKKLVLLFFSVIYSEDLSIEFPEKYFRTDHSLIDVKMTYEDFSCYLPINLKKIVSKEISLINDKVKLEENSFHDTDILDIYKNDEETFGLSISKIRLKYPNSIFKDEYRKHIVNSYLTENVFRFQFSLNTFEVIQYQINHSELIQLKLFLFIGDSIYSFDFLIDRNKYNDYLLSIESMLSTIKKKV